MGHKIPELRSEKGISQKDLSDILDISQSTYNKLENGEMDFRSEQLMVLSEYFKKPVGEFFGEKGNVYIQNNDNNSNVGQIHHNTDEKMNHHIANTLKTQQEQIQLFFEQNSKLQNDLISMLNKLIPK